MYIEMEKLSGTAQVWCKGNFKTFFFLSFSLFCLFFSVDSFFYHTFSACVTHASCSMRIKFHGKCFNAFDIRISHWMMTAVFVIRNWKRNNKRKKNPCKFSPHLNKQIGNTFVKQLVSIWGMALNISHSMSTKITHQSSKFNFYDIDGIDFVRQSAVWVTEKKNHLPQNKWINKKNMKFGTAKNQHRKVFVF